MRKHVTHPSIHNSPKANNFQLLWKPHNTRHQRTNPLLSGNMEYYHRRHPPQIKCVRQSMNFSSNIEFTGILMPNRRSRDVTSQTSLITKRYNYDFLISIIKTQIHYTFLRPVIKGDTSPVRVDLLLCLYILKNQPTHFVNIGHNI